MSCIVQLVTTLELGGAQKICLAIATHFQSLGIPTYLIYGEKGPLLKEAQQALDNNLIHANRLCRNIHLKNDIAALSQLRRILGKLHDRHGPLILHTHSSKAGILGRLAIPKRWAKMVCHTVHGFSFPNFPKSRIWLPVALERLASRQTQHVFFVSEADRRLAQEYGLFHKSTKHILRPGIDVALIQKASNHLKANDLFQRTGFKDDDLILISVANAKPQKDPLFHVDILASLHQESPKYHLVFLGDGPLLPAMRKKAEQMGLSTHLHTPGFVTDVSPYLHMSEGFLLASRFEGLPCAVLESLALGLPTFVRDSGWAQDIMPWAKTLHALPSSALPDAFSEAIHSSLQNRPERIPSNLPKDFTMEGMLGSLQQIYSSTTESLF